MIGVICFFVFVIIDQVTKTAAVANLKDQQPHVLVGNVFELFYLENRGAAFGILQGQKILFVIITIAILAVIFIRCECYWCWSQQEHLGILLIVPDRDMWLIFSI